MSAIAGIIDPRGIPVRSEDMEVMAVPIRAYKVDKVDIKVIGGSGMICGHQWITAESRMDVLPYTDEVDGIMMTADLILDNRDELGMKLGLSIETLSRTPDGALLFKAYKRWGIRCLDHLIGDFAFVIYDMNADLIFAAIDQVGKRILNYRYDEAQVFLFSTTFAPLLALKDGKTNLNEAWMAEFLALRLNFNVATIEETIHEGVYQLIPGEMLTIEKGRFKKETYWSVDQMKPIKLGSDEAYLIEFRRLMSEAVKCRIRTDASVGLMLSGGLDSSTVAAFAAPMLKVQGKKLYAYTSIPLKDAQLNLNPSQIADESSYIQELVDMYDNIEWTPTDSAGYDSYNQIDATLEMLEMPYKMVVNMHWTNHLTQLAAEQGCKVLLDGQFGNFTISQGEMLPYLGGLLKRGKWGRLLRELKAVGKVHRVGRKRVLRAVIRGTSITNTIEYKNVDSGLVDEQYAQSLEMQKRWKNAGLIGKIKASKMNRILLSHVGNIETRIGLRYGLLQRDPTRDMRILAYTSKIPENQFVRNGVGRALVRRGLKDLIPHVILQDANRMGIQGADWHLRAEQYKPRIKSEVSERNCLNDLKLQLLDNINMDDKIEADNPVWDKDAFKDILVILIIMRYSRKSIGKEVSR